MNKSMSVVGLGIALGVGIGTSLGVATGNVSLWLPLGTGLEIAIASGLAVTKSGPCRPKESKNDLVR